MAYLIGMILGNGEIQQGSNETIVTIDIPHKNLYTDDLKDVRIYVKASIVDIRQILEPLIGTDIMYTQVISSTRISFRKPNAEYVMRQILHYVGNGSKHEYMEMNPDLFEISTDEKKALLRGFADVTGYIRASNRAQQKLHHRVYLEIPGNWKMVIDIANMLKDVDVPIQNIDFGHPNFRDTNLVNYNNGKLTYWKKEHQIKIDANEFLTIGFNIGHKQEALEKYSKECLTILKPENTHKFYWERRKKSSKKKPIHPAENDLSLPIEIRGKHYDSWSMLARDLGYHE